MIKSTTHGIAAMTDSQRVIFTPETNPTLPPALFDPRERLVIPGEQPKAIILSDEWSLDSPINWHPAEWKKGTRLELLNLHYMEYLEALDDEHFERIILDWVSSNPLYHRGYWLDGWNSYALSIRCVVWMQQYERREQNLSPDFSRVMLVSLWEQLNFLLNNLEKDIGGNHLIKNTKALLWCAKFFDGKDTRTFAQVGNRLLSRELKNQILADGVHFERSPAYHAQVLADLLECYSVTDSAEKPGIGGVITGMMQAQIDLTHPDGLSSLFNDGGLHMTYSTTDCSKVFEGLLGSPPPPNNKILFPDAGYYGARLENSFFLWDCGKIGPDNLPAHAHGDILSFEWDYELQRVFVDAGVYEYNEGHWRDYSRSTRAHNTVTIGSQDQCEFWKSFRVGHRSSGVLDNCEHADSKFTAEGSHFGYRRLKGQPIHHRKVEVSRSGFNVSDAVIGGDGQAVRSRLLCHPDCEVELDQQGVVVSVNGARILLETTENISIEEGWWMPDFGVKIRTNQIVIDYGSAPCRADYSVRVDES